MSTPYSRRDFLRQIVGAGALAATGIGPALGESAIVPSKSFRFAFVTDMHLMEDPALRSEQGIAMCLDAVEKLNPRPDFIIMGGDLVNVTRDMTIAHAKDRLNTFQKIWSNHTSLPSHWVFGNHDLAGTSNPSVSPENPLYADGLFRSHFRLKKLFYSFDHKGWHFIVLNDIALDAQHLYFGALENPDLVYLRADLEAHRAMPTIICTHIPMMSNVPLAVHLAALGGVHINAPQHLVCTNASDLTADLPNHNVRAVLCGHLHHYERIDASGVAFINSGAVCGNYWRGPVMDCPEGFGVVDVGADGGFAFKYQPYGWKAA